MASEYYKRALHNSAVRLLSKTCVLQQRRSIYVLKAACYYSVNVAGKLDGNILSARCCLPVIIQ